MFADCRNGGFAKSLDKNSTAHPTPCPYTDTPARGSGIMTCMSVLAACPSIK